MTPLERVGAALAGAPSDARALSLTLSLYGARLSGASPADYFVDPRRYLAGQREAVRAFSPDIVFGPFALAMEAEGYGAELVWLAKAPPNVRKPISTPTARAASELSPLDPARDPSLAALVESTRLLALECAGSRPVAAVIAAPIDLPALILGLEAWIEALLFDRPTALEFLKLSTEHFLRLSDAYFKAGAAFAVCPVMLANPRLLLMDLIASLVLPALSQAFGAAAGPIVFHHGANPIGECASEYARLPRIGGIVADERDDLAAVRAAIGPGLALLGGFNGPCMESRSAEEMRGAVLGILEERSGDPRFLLASTAADIPWDTPFETVAAVRKAVDEAGAVGNRRG